MGYLMLRLLLHSCAPFSSQFIRNFLLLRMITYLQAIGSSDADLCWRGIPREACSNVLILQAGPAAAAACPLRSSRCSSWTLCCRPSRCVPSCRRPLHPRMTSSTLMCSVRHLSCPRAVPNLAEQSRLPTLSQSGWPKCLLTFLFCYYQSTRFSFHTPCSSVAYSLLWSFVAW